MSQYDRSYRARRATAHLMQGEANAASRVDVESEVSDKNEEFEPGFAAEGMVSQADQQELDEELADAETFLEDAEEVYVSYRDARNRSSAIRRARGFPPRVNAVKKRAFTKRRWPPRNTTGDRTGDRFGGHLEASGEAQKFEKTKARRSIEDLKKKYPCRICGQFGH